MKIKITIKELVLRDRKKLTYECQQANENSPVGYFQGKKVKFKAIDSVANYNYLGIIYEHKAITQKNKNYFLKQLHKKLIEHFSFERPESSNIEDLLSAINRQYAYFIKGAGIGFFEKLALPAELGAVFSQYLDYTGAKCLVLTTKLAYQEAKLEEQKASCMVVRL